MSDMLINAGNFVSSSKKAKRFPLPFVEPDTIRFTSKFDSLGDQFKQNAPYFNTAIEQYFPTSGGVQDMSNAGDYRFKSSAIAVNPLNTNYQFDDSTNTHGPSYETLLSAITSPPSSSDVAIDWGNTNDCNPAVTIERETFLPALYEQINADKADFISWQKYILILQNRNLDPSASDENYQETRELQMIAAQQEDFVVLSPPFYDCDLDVSPNNVHFTPVAYQTIIANRLSLFVARLFGKVDSGGYGPEVSAAAFEIVSVLCTVSHDGGNDISITNQEAKNIFRAVVDGQYYEPSSVVKVSPNQFRLFFDNAGFEISDITEIKVVFGAMKGLSRTNPGVIIDNAAVPIPLRPALLQPKILHPNAGKDFTLELIPKLASKTGSPVSSITDQSGQNWNAVVGREATYDSTKLGNFGALVAGDDTTAYVNSINTTALAWNRIYLVIEFPETVPVSGAHIIGYGTSASAQPTPRCSLLIQPNGDLVWQRNQAEGSEIIANDVRGQSAVIVLDLKSTEDADAYYNTVDPVISFDPRDNVPGQNRLWIFGGDDSGTGAVQITAAGTAIGYCMWHTASSEPENIPTIPEMVEFLAAQANISLS